MLTSIEFMASCKYLRFWNILTSVYLKRLLDSELVRVSGFHLVTNAYYLSVVRKIVSDIFSEAPLKSYFVSPGLVLFHLT